MAFHVMILCGGSGTRLWPTSRDQLPKQFAPLLGEKTLYQRTLDRAVVLDPSSIIVVTAENQAKLCRLGGFKAKPLHVVAEPLQRNTLPAIIYGCAGLSDEDVVLMMPSDHLIGDWDALKEVTQRGIKLAEQDYIVTYGIEPDHPATGYGYIESGDALSHGGHQVAAFIEKPPVEKARDMLQQGGFSWNSGMFVFKVGHLKSEVAAFEPALSPLFNQSGSISAEAYGAYPKQSFDYGIAERSKRMAVIPVSFPWNDLGSWSAVWDETKTGDDGIALSPGLQLLQEDSSQLLVHSDRSDEKIYAAVGLSQIAIVDTQDALLVANLNAAQGVKAVREKAASLRPDVVKRPTSESRPWGSFEILQEYDHFKVKRLIVKPGCRLSLQSHQHRNEHWVVVRGEATVVNGPDELTLPAGESTFIPAGNKHRLANFGSDMLEVIEVQTGSYFGEDDIVRYEDDFGRHQ